MLALTLWEPWASLMAWGVKTIETRPWGTQVRDRIGVHSSRREDYARSTTQDPGFAHLARQLQGAGMTCRCGHPGGAHAFPVANSAGSVVIPASCAGCECINWTPAWPLGCVTATVRITECTVMVEPERAPMLSMARPVLSVGRQLVIWRDGVQVGDVTEQRPYGNFTPGRFAWHTDLEALMRLDPPAPAKGHQKLWTWAA